MGKWDNFTGEDKASAAASTPAGRSGPTGTAPLPRGCGLCDDMVTEDGQMGIVATAIIPLPPAAPAPSNVRRRQPYLRLNAPGFDLPHPHRARPPCRSPLGCTCLSKSYAPGTISHRHDPLARPATKVPTLATDQSTNSPRQFVKQSTTPTHGRTAGAWKTRTTRAEKSMHLPRIPKSLEASLLRQTEVLCGPSLSVAHQPHSPTRTAAQHDFIAPSDPTYGDSFSLRVRPLLQTWPRRFS